MYPVNASKASGANTKEKGSGNISSSVFPETNRSALVCTRRIGREEQPRNFAPGGYHARHPVLHLVSDTLCKKIPTKVILDGLK